VNSDDLGEDADPWIDSPLTARKGRGAISQLAGRFETQLIAVVDDGWWQGEDDAGQPLKTRITPETAKTILTRNQSPDLPFSVSLNPYRGCEHGCIYCFARPTHSYLGLSPGLDFETLIYAKTNAPDLLRRELAAKSYQPETIMLGINTDAYQPCERQLRLTRQCLEVLAECRHPVGLITKSSLIERDLDLLAPMAEQNLVMTAVTITTLDHQLARILEPRAAAPHRRLETVRRLAQAGIPVAVNVAPLIPFITEQELERVMAAAAEAGASSLGYTVLRLPWEVNPLFQEWLQAHFPERAERVMNRIRDLRGGKDYEPSFGKRMHGEGVWAELIRQRFHKGLKRLGLEKDNFRALSAACFRPPRQVPKADVPGGQRDLFG